MVTDFSYKVFDLGKFFLFAPYLRILL